MTLRAVSWLSLSAVALGAAGFGTYAWLQSPRHSDRVVLVYDRSASKRDVCDAVVGVAARKLASHRWGRGDTFIVLATGDASTLGEPVEAFRFDDFKRQRIVEGRSQGETAQRDLLERVRLACEALPPTEMSPIYLAARRGAELLPRDTCSPERCSLSLITDGEETAEAWMVATLRGIATKAALPARIPNAHARVQLCGFAEISSPPPLDKPTKSTKRRRNERRSHDSQRADRMTEMWRSLFEAPPSVELEPICAKRKAAPSSSPG
jgi:hypothetical protein